MFEYQRSVVDDEFRVETKEVENLLARAWTHWSEDKKNDFRKYFKDGYLGLEELKYINRLIDMHEEYEKMPWYVIDLVADPKYDVLQMEAYFNGLKEICSEEDYFYIDESYSPNEIREAAEKHFEELFQRDY